MISSAFKRSLAARSGVASRPAFASRHLHASPSSRFPRKDSMGKDDLKPEPNEYAKSGSDDGAAAEDAAFNPDKTSPEEEHDAAGGESGSKGEDNPLNVSPANQSVSQPKDAEEGGAGSAQTGGGKEKSSGGSSAPKSGGTTG